MQFFKLFLLLTIFCKFLFAIETEKVSVQLVWKNQFQFAGYYMAKEKGFYKKLGIDVSINEYQNGINTTDDVISGKTDFAVGRSSLTLDKLDGKPIVLLAAIFQHSPIILLSKKRKDIKSIGDLKNKKLMMTNDQVGLASINAMLLSNGINNGMYQLQKHSFNIQDLIDDKIDAITAYISNEPYSLSKKNIEYTIFSPKDYGFDLYSDILFTSEKLIKEKPELVENFRNASLQGWKYALEHIDETVEVILQKYNTQNRDKNALTYEANTIVDLVDEQNIKLGYIDKNKIDSNIQLYRLLGLVQNNSTIENLIYGLKKEEISNLVELSDKENKSLNIYLTKEEQKWIENNPTIKVANEMDWAPFDYMEGKKPAGISIEYIEILAKKIGLKVEFINGHTWGELISLFKNKEIDVLPAFYKNKEREKFTLFTEAYSKGKMGVFLKKDVQTIKSYKDLVDKKIGIQASDATISIAKTALPNSKFVEITSNDELVIALATGKVDAIIGNPIVFSYYAKEHQISNITLIDYIPMSKEEQLNTSLHIGVDKDNPMLYTLLEKAIKNTTDVEFSELEDKWTRIQTSTKSEKDLALVKFTREEKQWIETNTVSIGVEPWAPIIYSKNGKDIEGITGDILKLMIKNSGLKTEVVTDFWDPLLESFKNKEIDLLPATYYTQERAKYGLYSKPYYKMLDYIYVRNDTNTITSMNDLKGKKLAVPKGFGTIPKIQKKFPSIKIVETNDLSDSIIRLLKGDVDALFEGQIAVEHKITDELITGIKGIPQSDFKAAPLHFFSKIDEPLLQSILQKSFDSIPLEDIKKIKAKWVNISSQNKIVNIDEVEEGIPWFLLISIVSLLLIATIALIIIRFLPDELIAKYFGSKHFKTIVLFGMGVIVILILLLAFNTLERNKKTILKTFENDLHFVLNTTTSRLDAWIKDRNNYLRQLGRDPKLVKLTQQINKTDPNKESLISSDAQKEIREFFRKRKSEFGDLGFFIINKNNISVASKRDTNIGSKNIIAKYKPELINQVFEGKAVFVPPIPSDVELTTNKILSKNDRKQMTMFFAVPIEDEDGNVISILTQRLKMEGELSNIIQSGYMGSSGESYIFNKDGFMLTKSRFRDELYKIGLLKSGEKEYQKLVIRDPGINLLKNTQTNIDISNRPLTLMTKNAINLSNGLTKGYSDINTNIIGYRDYRGVLVYGAWVWSKDLDFGITSEMDEEEALKSFYILRQNLLIITVLTLLLTIISTILLIVLGEKATRSVQSANDELNKLLDSFDENVIASRSDLKGNITYASKAFAEISGYKVAELIGKPHSTVRHPDMPKEVFHGLWKTIKSGEIWRGEVKNRTKDGGFYWVDAVITPEFNDNGNLSGFSAIRHDITAKKEVENLSKNLELKVEERTLKLKESEERFELTIAGSGDGLWEYDYIKDKLWWSPRFIEMLGYEENELEINLDTYFSHIHLDDVAQQADAYQDHLKTDCVYDNTYRTIKKDGTCFWTRVRGKTVRDENGRALKTSGSIVDVTEQRNRELLVQSLHKNTSDSIEYASLIQHALIPEQNLFDNYFKDHLTIWQPKDIVGGDIYLFEELREQNECLLMVIDCTGHGVPGAFVTMLVKAIERQIISKIENDRSIDVSPSWILSYFNRTMKKLLQQESEDSLSNAGFDGGVIYYNKEKQLLKFAGAETPLFYVEDEELKTIKGNRHSIGYKKSDIEYEFKEYNINVKEDMKFYLTTDGYFDQNGGDKGFPFGKKRFKEFLEKNNLLPFADQQELLLYNMQQYQANEERNDDITVVGIKLIPEKNR